MPVSRLFTLIAILLIALASTVYAQTDDSEIPPEASIRFVQKLGVPGLKLDMYLKADVETVWTIINDRKKIEELFTKVTLSPVKDKPKMRRYDIKSFFGTKTIFCEVSRDKDEYRLSWKRVEGDFERFQGYWQLDEDTDYDGYIKVEYFSLVDPGFVGRRFLKTDRRKKDIVDMTNRLLAMVEKPQPKEEPKPEAPKAEEPKNDTPPAKTDETKPAAETKPAQETAATENVEQPVENGTIKTKI